jgi:hypothetical protein
VIQTNPNSYIKHKIKYEKLINKIKYDHGIDGENPSFLRNV